jgi:L,D-transpeptidase ErfK/SrfK
MTLYVNGQRREQFTIGLGEGESTPKGDFTIGTKLTDPDWFNRGEVVPAGDPDNLIGKRWLGLARNGALTPYGIHPTNDLNSLGGDKSRGCIRVTESDANTLFRLCPVGTKVVIR